MKTKIIFLILFILSVPVLAKAEEEQAEYNIFQQYEQPVVKLHDYSQDNDFMNPFMWGFGPWGFYGGMRHYGHNSHNGHHGHHSHHGHSDYGRTGGFYFGPNFWSGRNSNNEHVFDNKSETTLVDPSTYSFQPENNI